MKTEIITIGTEITTGGTLNTNSYFLAKELLGLGIEVTYQTSIDDNPIHLKEAYEIALGRADLIITTGGLGPTEDDRTKEVLVDFLGLGLREDPEVLEEIKEKFRGRPNIPSNNFKQAVGIEGGSFIKNRIGTAPGIFLEYEGKKIILLPGPPREMEPMFNSEVRPLLNGESLNIITRSINIAGIGESQIEMDIKDLIHLYDDIEIATFGKIKNVEVRLIARGEDREILVEKIDYILGELEARFKDNILAYDNASIEEVVLELLRDKGLKVAFAESCTGGLLSSRLVRLPGASDVFDRGKVTYSNEAKIQELGVSPATLKEYGAVSSPTAEEMVKGLLATSSIDLGLAITGIVGPKSDSTNKPVGLVYISISNRKTTEVKEYRLLGDRRNLQDRIVENALFNLREFVMENY